MALRNTGVLGRGRRAALAAPSTVVAIVTIGVVGAAALGLAACSDGVVAGGPAGSDGGVERFDGSTPAVTAEICPPPIAPVDASSPDVIVGDGTPQSCTEAALADALGRGGVIIFRCGGPHTLVVTSEKTLTRSVTLDGGGLITLSGGGTTRILNIGGGSSASDISVTLQNLRFTRGRAADSGAAVLRRGGGRLTVWNCKFFDSSGPSAGKDTAGGALFSQGGDTVLVGSVFAGNSSSNGGAVGVLRSNLVIVNSRFEGNTAAGSGIDPGDGGRGGAVYIDGLNVSTDKRLDVCGSAFTGNQAGALGGALFRYGYAGEVATIDRSTFDGNLIPTAGLGLGGAIYFQNGSFRLTASTISNNTAHGAGGLFVHGDANPGTPIEFTNLTITGNRAVGTLGGGLTFSGSVSGTVLNTTIARNRAFSGGGISGGGPTLKNSIVSHNQADDVASAINCSAALSDGGGNLQWPSKGASGAPDLLDHPCVNGITGADAQLGLLADNGGPTRTLALLPQSPAVGKGSGCPQKDQRGVERGASCDSGSVKY